MPTSDHMRGFGDELRRYAETEDMKAIYGLAVRLGLVGDWMDRETNKVIGSPRRRINGHLLIDPELCDHEKDENDKPDCPVCDWGFGVCEDCGAAEAMLDQPCAGNVAKLEEHITVEAGGDISLFHIATGESISVHNAIEDNLLIYPLPPKNPKPEIAVVEAMREWYKRHPDFASWLRGNGGQE